MAREDSYAWCINIPRYTFTCCVSFAITGMLTVVSTGGSDVSMCGASIMLYSSPGRHNHTVYLRTLCVSLEPVWVFRDERKSVTYTIL